MTEHDARLIAPEVSDFGAAKKPALIRPDTLGVLIAAAVLVYAFLALWSTP